MRCLLAFSWINGISDKWAAELDRKIGESVPQESLAGALGSLEESLSDYPTLV